MDNSFNRDDEYGKQANDELKKVRGKEFTKKKIKRREILLLALGVSV